jgi:CRISPR-associated endonuclease/helicase Cas3
MAPDTTPPGGATRYLQTSRGLLSYSQLASLLAEQVLRIEREIASGTFAARALSPELILDLHRQIAGGLCPDWAGRWRDAEVRVGDL